MKSSEGVHPTAPWNEAAMHNTAQLPTYAEAIGAGGAPYPMQMPQPHSQQPIPPYPIQQPPYPTSPEFQNYSQPNSAPVYQQYQPYEHNAPIINHPPTHVQHIVTHLPTEQRGCSGRRGTGVVLGIVVGLLILGAIVRASVRGF